MATEYIQPAQRARVISTERITVSRHKLDDGTAALTGLAFDAKTGHRIIGDGTLQHPLGVQDEAAEKPAPLVVDYAVIEHMRRWGGGFVSRLAEAWQCADSTNSAKLAAAFGDYYATYADSLAKSQS